MRDAALIAGIFAAIFFTAFIVLELVVPKPGKRKQTRPTGNLGS